MTPTVAIIEPNHIAEISVHHQGYETKEEYVDGAPQNCWWEDVRDKEVMLVVEVRGSCTTERKSHKVRVRHTRFVRQVRKPKLYVFFICFFMIFLNEFK